MSTLSLSRSPVAFEYGIFGRKPNIHSYSSGGMKAFPSMSSYSDPTRASVSHLMVRTLSLPCSTAAQAFSQLIQPTMRFQVALDVLLPILESSSQYGHESHQINELPQRILASYILYSLYAPYPISINPFKTALFATFVKERRIALIDTSGMGSNEQLVWVLWKILKGDGNDIAPYSPSTLARSPLPPKLRAVNLTLSEDELADDTISFQLGNGTIPSPRTVQPYVFNETDTRKEEVARAMTLLLAAKERVLTLTEQKFLNPLLPTLLSPPIDNLTTSHNDQATNGRGILLTSVDLAPIVNHNPTIAFSFLVVLLSNPPPNQISVSEASFSDPSAGGMPAPALPNPLVGDVDLSPTRFLDVVATLPPTFSSFDLIGRLLRDTTPVPIPGASLSLYAVSDEHTGNDLASNAASETGSGGDRVPKMPIADLIRTEYLGPFVHSCIDYLDAAEREEKEGLSSDDRWAIGVRHLCRFYQSLIKLGIVDTSSDAESAEMAHFSLRNARFEEAMALYKVLATANADTGVGAF